MAASLILLAPFIVFIDFHGHPFSNPEVLWLISGILLFGWACGIILKNMRPLGRAILFACLLEFSLDLIGGFDDTGKIICAVTAFLFAWFARSHAPKILSVTFSVFIITTLVFPSDQLKPTYKEYGAISGQADLPPIVHLILDGHTGVEGIPQNIAGGPQLKKGLISFYADNGFRLYGNAYSHHSITLNSIPSLLNFDADIKVDKSYTQEIATDYEYEWLRNKYFEKMSALGYRIKVYQSTYLDYCQGNFRIASCYTYPLFSTRFLDDLSLKLDSKIWVLLNSYLVRSNFFKIVKNGYWHSINFIHQRFGLELPFPWKWDGQVTSPVAVSQTLRLLTEDIRSSPAGTLFFAHLLVPHAPFVYDSHCQIFKNPISEWSVSVNPLSDKKLNSTSSRAKRYKMYFQQTTCLNEQLRELFDVMRAAKIYEDATIIIHGDHGSRIRIRRPTLANRNDLTPEDLLDSFSTLFAVKIPGDKADYDLRVLSLNQIFSPVAGKMFNIEQNIDPQFPYVNLRVRDADEKKKRSFFRRPFTALTDQ